MKCLIVGDPHIQVQRIDDGKRFLDALVPYVMDHEGTIILGDLFHTFAIIRSEVLSLWNDFFNKVLSKDIVVLVGNHDYAGQSGGSHALEVFHSFPNITVIDSLTLGQRIYYAPFYRDNKKFEGDCRMIPANKILLCHQSFNGAKFGNGFYDPNGADPKCVEHLKYVISGHIHNRQMLSNIWYPGVPYQHSFAEAGYDTKIFTVDLDADSLKIEKEHQIEMPGYIQIEGSLEEIVTKLQNPNPMDSYKIVSKGTPAEISTFWKEPKVQEFKKNVRRLVDAIIPERGEIQDDIFRGKRDKRERFESFIKSKKWRTSSDRVSAAARTFFSV